MNEVSENTGTLLGHPKGLFVLFFTEMWERFSYYGMRALLILYLTKHFLFGDAQAGLIFGSYASLVYAMPVLGGLIADRYLGFRKAITFGAILLVCGHFGMAFEGPPAIRLEGQSEVVRDDFYNQIFYLSLAFIVVGVGFLKANISTIVGQLYEKGDPRRDAGFTIFYMGINIGAFVATLLCAYLGENYGWRYGFGLAGIGMLIGLLTFQSGRKYLLGYGEPLSPEVLTQPVLGNLFPLVTKEKLIYLVGLLTVVAIWQVIQRTAELGLMLSVFGALVVSWVIWFSVSQCEPKERDRMLVMLVLIALSVLFWALFEQAGSSLTLFTDRNVAMGNIFTAGMFQSLNPLFIILFAPLFAILWVVLGRRKWEPSTPAKFGLGILQVGLGFAVLIFGASQAGPDGKVSVIWLALMYLLHTTGELCLSPVGLSMVTKLSVQRVAAMMMGVWFMSSAFAAYAAGMIAGLMAIGEGGAVVETGVESLAVYVGVFEKLAIVAIVLGILVLIASPFLHRRM
ncbi:MAG: MFS transporter [Gammaproteobacteria bacterium]|jgi:POT family proton-dependent oligopeptide transporter|nr:MFS transporter [Gammaproteobacteria bacterium]|tara:strand:+ start:9226 stop:10761 length:1536 start_codon:yes stop_codon:yes gene_type:complete